MPILSFLASSSLLVASLASSALGQVPRLLFDADPAPGKSGLAGVASEGVGWAAVGTLVQRSWGRVPASYLTDGQVVTGLGTNTPSGQASLAGQNCVLVTSCNSDFRLWNATTRSHLLSGRGNWEAGLFRLGTYILFSVQGSSGTVLWRTDGTASGTETVKDAAGAEIPVSLDLFGFSQRALFAGRGPQGGYEVWETDGTTAGTRSLLPGPLFEAVEIDGQVIFSAGTYPNTQLHVLDSAGLRPLPSMAGRSPPLSGRGVGPGVLFG